MKEGKEFPSRTYYPRLAKSVSHQALPQRSAASIKAPDGKKRNAETDAGYMSSKRPNKKARVASDCTKTTKFQSAGPENCTQLIWDLYLKGAQDLPEKILSAIADSDKTLFPDDDITYPFHVCFDILPGKHKYTHYFTLDPATVDDNDDAKIAAAEEEEQAKMDSTDRDAKADAAATAPVSDWTGTAMAAYLSANNTWKCHGCTMQNLCDENICAACKKVRPQN